MIGCCEKLIRKENTISDKKTRINGAITASEVRLIDQEGSQVGILSTIDALSKAREVGLDLVEISPNDKPPVCRIMDYGRYHFARVKKRSANKKKQKQVQLKEVKFRPVTDIGDYNVKLKKITRFLERGDKVKISMRFRGREMQHRQLGMEFLKRVEGDLPEGYVIEQEPKLDDRKQLTMVVYLGKQNK